MKYIKQKKYSIIESIKKVFKRQKIIDQYKVNKYFIDIYFPEQKLGFEIDENNHLDRCNIKKQKREEMIKNDDMIKNILIFLMKYLEYKILFLNLE